MISFPQLCGTIGHGHGGVWRDIYSDAVVLLVCSLCFIGVLSTNSDVNS